MKIPILRLVIFSGIGLVVVAGVVYLAYQKAQFPSAAAPLIVPQSVVLKGAAVKGAVFTSVDNQGRSLQLKIQDVEIDPKDPLREIYLYTIVYQDPASSNWQNLCQPDRDQVAKALPLSGQWDAKGNYQNNGITLACTNGVLAKCVRWGYKPWKTEQGYSLRDFLQACTRMVRADYCGKGTAHTQEGIRIDVYDRLGIQKRAEHTGMVFEAAWGPNGAIAINRTRFPEMFAQIQQECPERIKPLQNQAGINGLSMSTLQRYAPDALIFNDSFATPQIVKGVQP